jgi:hypothetical protein
VVMCLVSLSQYKGLIKKRETTQRHTYLTFVCLIETVELIDANIGSHASNKT